MITALFDRIRAVIVISLVIGIVFLVVVVLLLHATQQRAQREVKDAQAAVHQLNDNLQRQGAVVAQQFRVFQRMNALAAAAEHYRVMVEAQSDAQQVIIRKSIKPMPAGRQCVPATVSKRLYDHANRLRSDALFDAASGVDPAGSGATAAPCRLTYGQAVYWLEPLLTALEEADEKLVAIRQADQQR
jgi:type II secretory pathway pseudopilin PulG